MRAFTLAGLLIAVCIGLLIFAKFEMPVAKTGQQIKPAVQEIAGRGENGEDASRSITYDADYQGSKLKGVVVKSIVSGGAMEKHFGLKVRDEIVQVGENPIDIYGSDQLAETQGVFTDGFQHGNALTVLRDGQTLVLPKGANPHESQLPFHMNLPRQ